MKSNGKETWVMRKDYETLEEYSMASFLYIYYGVRDKPLQIHSQPHSLLDLIFESSKFCQKLRKEYVSLYDCESLLLS